MAKHSELRSMVRLCYDMQKLRIQAGNRVAAIFLQKLDKVAPDQKQRDKILTQIKKEHARLADSVTNISPKTLRKFTGGDLITSSHELLLAHQYVNLIDTEVEMFKQLSLMLPDFPIYDWLKDIKGVGPRMAAVIISEFDITKAEYPSSLHAYAGLDVGPDGKARSKRAEHLVDRSYTKADGTVGIKKSITFNPFLKSRLVGVLGGAFLRAGATDNPYRKIYDDYKHRLQHNPRHKEKTKSHIHNMAIRYMIKMFLNDLYNAWRELEGLPVAPPYHEAKLGLTHKKAA
jgi:hypothetical protein